MSDIPVCRDVQLPFGLALQAGRFAERINPANAVPPHSLGILSAQFSIQLPIHPEHTAILNSAYWGVRGVHCTVGFMHQVPAEFAQHFFEHANAWGQYANVIFTPAGAGEKAMVRVTCRGDGYWSYLGPQIISVPANQPTMCLQDFDRGMPESEWRRVVRHEVGHTLGLLHEHMLPEIIELLDPQAVIADFMATQGWSRQMVVEQILTPPRPGTYTARKPSVDSIMCYQFAGKDTRNGQPIPGGLDITPDDGEFVGSLYPRASGLKPMTADEILSRLADVL
jgi:hypothetical protein